MSTQKSKIALVVLVVVVLFAIWITTGTQGKEVPFVSIQELKTGSFAQDRFRLGGTVQEGSINISEANLLEMNFILSQGGETLRVHYGKTRPDLFKDGAEVIVEGRYAGGVFQADNLMTKCASRYEGDLRDEASYQKGEL